MSFLFKKSNELLFQLQMQDQNRGVKNNKNYWILEAGYIQS